MTLGSIVQSFRPDLRPFEELYKDIHRHAELSGRESRTASVVAKFLLDHNFVVHEHIGGYGVVGILENGPGKVVLLRSELDALPILEQTGLPYASTKRMLDTWGREQPVMHACGHDLHMACLMATSNLMLKAKSHWQGTLIALFQPNEEHTGGAHAMVDGGLYDHIPVPNAVLAQHAMLMKSGMVSIKEGPVLVSSDIMKVRIFASEGHPANPQFGIDSVVVAGKVIVQLEVLVGKVSVDGYASIHVDEIHAGQPGLDVVDYTDLVLDVKAYKPEIRTQLLAAIQNLVETESKASGAIKKPEITVKVRAPLTNNSAEIVQPLREQFQKYFGEDMVSDQVPSHPCEDFSILATSRQVQYAFWFFGRVNPQEFDEAEKHGAIIDRIANEHSPFNAPDLSSALKTGTDALALAALNFLHHDNCNGRE